MGGGGVEAWGMCPPTLAETLVFPRAPTSQLSGWRQHRFPQQWHLQHVQLCSQYRPPSGGEKAQGSSPVSGSDGGGHKRGRFLREYAPGSAKLHRNGATRRNSHM